jgi:hypothetical protein
MDWHDRWLPGVLRRIGSGGWNLACERGHRDRLASLYDDRSIDDEAAFVDHVRRDIEQRRGEPKRAKDHTVDSISDKYMQRQLQDGTAEPVRSLGEQLVRQAGFYWARDGADWFRVTDPEMPAFIDDAQRRLDLADQAVTDAQRGRGEP